MCNAIISVVGMPAVIAIEVVPHVNEFFSDHQLDGTRLRSIDAVQMNEYCVLLGPSHETIGAAIRGRNQPPDPLLVRLTTGGHHQVVDWKSEQCNIPFDQFGQLIVTLIQNHVVSSFVWGSATVPGWNGRHILQ